MLATKRVEGSRTFLQKNERTATRKAWTIKRKRALTAWLFLLPSLLVLTVFLIYPMIQAGYLSLTNYNLIRQAEFVGFSNYIELWHDPAFWNSMRVTAFYAIVVTPVTVFMALGLALLLNRKFVGRSFTRTAVFLPFIVSLGIVSIAWSFLLDPRIGLLAYWFRGLGIVPEQGWLADPRYALAAVMIVGIWKNVGFYMVMYLAGLQSIPADLYEAARLDGTNVWQRFRNVTWPLLSNQTLLVSVMALIATLQAFDQIYVMTRGGPFFRTETLVMLVYRQGFQELRFGYGAAISYVLLFIVFVFSMVQWGYFRRKQVRF